MAIRFCTFASLIALSAPATLLAASPAAAQSARLSMPALPLGQALQRIAAETGAKIASDPDAVSGETSNPVVNAASPRDAVRQAIAGKPVALTINEDGSMTIVNDIVVTAQRDEAELNVLVRGDTTSSRTGESLRDQPRNTQVISSKLLAEQQAQTIAEALRNAGGVTVNQSLQGGSTYSVRGFASNGSVNGMTTAASASFASGSTNSLVNIERLEVLKGPDAILLGSDNQGGTVNLVTKKPGGPRQLFIGQDLGSFGLVRSTVDVNSPLTENRTLSARFIGTAATARRNYGGYTGNDDLLAAPSLRFKNDRTDLILSASFGEQSFGVTPYRITNTITRQLFDLPIDRPIVRERDQFISVKITQFTGDLTHRFTDWLTVVLRAQQQVQQVGLRNYQPAAIQNTNGQMQFFGSGSRQGANNDVFDGYARFDFKTGPFTHKIVAGATDVDIDITSAGGTPSSLFSYNIVNPVAAPPPFPTTFTKSFDLYGHQRGYYGQYLLKFWRLSLLAGARHNKTSSQTITPGVAPGTKFEGGATTPNYGAVFELDDDVSFFGTLAYGYRATFNLDRNGERLPDNETRNIEAGVKIDFFKDRMLLNASWFKIRQSNSLITDPVNRRFLIAAPGLEGEGIDVNLSGQPIRDLTVITSFTRTNYVQLTPSTLGNVIQAQPRDKYSVYASYRGKVSDDVTAGGGVGVFGRSSSGIDRLGVYRTPGALQVDLNGFVTFEGVEVNLGIRNLFDRLNYGTTTSPLYRSIDETRNVRLSLGYRFR